ncbi:MAG: ROK family protein [Gemmatimonadetes bacterium]|nr:ROK family protein [Gemmatimonadota bacterium]NNK63198.1 ROK family protein [Gemmatimonadota bacterium]
MSEQRWIVGVDIGGTNLVVGVVPAAGGPPRALRGRATDAARGPEAVVTDIVRMAREAVREVRDVEGGAAADVVGIGVGCPGPIDRENGVVVESPNLRWRDYPLRDRVEALVDWPVVVDNDANCATYGEWWQGAGRGSRSLVGITVGTGIGGGYILDGRLVHGASDGAGEVGHTTINLSGRRCACGNEGCLEAYASGPAIAARAREGLELGAESVLHALVENELERVTAATVYEAVLVGDQYATGVMTETAKFLGAGIANAINMLNPEVVVIMGGVTQAGEHLFVPLKAEVRRRAFRAMADACRILPAELPNTSGVVGAAGIAAAELGMLGG